MNEVRVAVGIGNTTINIGVCESPLAQGVPIAKGTPTKTPTRAGQPTDASPLSHDTANAWRWSRQVTVETAGFDPAALDLKPPRSAPWQVASVHRASEQRLAAWVQQTYPQASYRNLTAADLPIKVQVEQPERVGMDRLAAAVAVNQLRDPRLPAVIVDAGTAITVDLVNVTGDFLGGAILPGMRLVSAALADQTDLLPRVDTRFRDPAPPLGKSTEQAIRSGLFWGSVGAIRELVTRLADAEAGPPQVFLTGGDAECLAPYISPTAIFVRDLVLGGILTAKPVAGNAPGRPLG